MNSHPPRRISQFAFTLIELLTVITIIAILMGLLFPAIGVVKDQARKAEAKAAVAGIAAAVKQYYTEYGKYPVAQAAGATAPTADLMYGDPSLTGTPISNEFLFNVLRNIPSTATNNAAVAGSNATALNPRAIVFFEGKAATTDAPRSGFIPSSATTGAGSFVDPWGKQYCIAIDTDYDNQITNLPYQDFLTTNGPRTGVAVFSLGKDGVLGAKVSSGSTGDGYYRNATSKATSDDVITWQ
jgi:prepilin-type N-terminal cleavage/methylation domain-containing protein